MAEGVPENKTQYVVRTPEKSCSSDSRFRRKLSGTTGHHLLGTQRPQMLCVAAWVWFCLATEFVDSICLSFFFLLSRVKCIDGNTPKTKRVFRLVSVSFSFASDQEHCNHGRGRAREQDSIWRYNVTESNCRV